MKLRKRFCSSKFYYAFLFADVTKLSLAGLCFGFSRENILCTDLNISKFSSCDLIDSWISQFFPLILPPLLSSPREDDLSQSIPTRSIFFSKHFGVQRI
jgi:hypothetical protein